MHLRRVGAWLLTLLFWPPDAMSSATPEGRSRSRTVRSPGAIASRSRAPTAAPAANSSRVRSRSGAGKGRGRGCKKRGGSKKSDALGQRTQGLDCQCNICEKWWQAGMSWGEVVTKMVEGISVTEAVGVLCKDCMPVGASFPISVEELAEQQDTEELSGKIDESRARSSGSMAPITERESVDKKDTLRFQGAGLIIRSLGSLVEGPPSEFQGQVNKSLGFEPVLRTFVIYLLHMACEAHSPSQEFP